MLMKKTAQNDVTGDWIQSKPNSDQFGEGWDRIFGKKKALEKSIEENEELLYELDDGQFRRNRKGRRWHNHKYTRVDVMLILC